MLKKRYLDKFIKEDIQNKMVFIGGPRQVGKTTLAKLVGKKYKKPVYLNWDFRDDRKKIIEEKFESGADLIIFDEIHKYKQWRNYIKGEFDKNKDKYDIIVTGSARLDYYRRGGDSLLGRYHYFRLHPFSLAEAIGIQPEIEVLKESDFLIHKGASSAFDRLFKFGGFPEPFIKQDMKTLRRFHNERKERLVKEDIRDMESIRDLSSLELLTEMIPEKVGSMFSLNSLKEDLAVTHKTVSLWVDVLERFYYHFRIYPFASTKIKSLRKEPKIYLWDWSEIDEEASGFENMIASHLLKLVHFLYDYEGYRTGIYFLRDVDKREVDFIVTEKEKPWFALEVKLNDTNPSKRLKYFADRLKIPYLYQVVKKKDVDKFIGGVRVVSADKFLAALV